MCTKHTTPRPQSLLTLWVQRWWSSAEALSCLRLFVFRVCAVVNLRLSESVNLHTIANTVQKKSVLTSNIWVVFIYAWDVGNGARDVETVYIQDAIRVLQSVQAHFYWHLWEKLLKNEMCAHYPCEKGIHFVLCFLNANMLKTIALTVYKCLCLV